MEIKNKLTVTRWEGHNRGRRGRVKSRNMYEGSMDTDNWVGENICGRCEVGTKGE